MAAPGVRLATTEKKRSGWGEEMGSSPCGSRKACGGLVAAEEVVAAGELRSRRGKGATANGNCRTSPSQLGAPDGVAIAGGPPGQRGRANSRRWLRQSRGAAAMALGLRGSEEEEGRRERGREGKSEWGGQGKWLASALSSPSPCGGTRRRAAAASVLGRGGGDTRGSRWGKEERGRWAGPDELRPGVR